MSGEKVNENYREYLKAYTRHYNRNKETYRGRKITEEEAETHQRLEKSNPTTKRWKDVTNKEINQQKKNYCLYCKYSSTMGSSGSKGNVNEFNGVVCDYIGKTGKRRGCSPIGCVKFERRKGRKSKNED